jgi:hypothetical protein
MGPCAASNDDPHAASIITTLKLPNIVPEFPAISPD